MSYQQSNISMPLTPVVKYLMIINVAVWLIFQIVLEAFFQVKFTSLFALSPDKVIFNFYIWQPLTYMFLHSLDWSHIVFNMLSLWWLGAELEQRWGKKMFITYYIFSGFGAALLYILGMWAYALVTGNPQGLVVPVIGASGAVFGLMLAYGLLFGDRVIHFMMLFPMKARYFVMLLGAIQVISMMTSSVTGGGGVAYLAHLGGLAAGYIYLKFNQWNQKRMWNQKLRKRGRNLRLVVDNETDKKDGPKYWH